MAEGAVPLFESKITVTFGDCDPAGILYFARIFDFSHQVFEEFIEQSGIGWANWFRKGPFIVPLKHVEADYQSPLLPGQSYSVKARVARLGDSSFEMEYSFLGTESSSPKTHAVVKMVHVFADAENHKKISIPEPIRSKLQQNIASSK